MVNKEENATLFESISHLCQPCCADLYLDLWPCCGTNRRTIFVALTADAYWSPYWFSAGRCGGGEDAALLPFWEQRHVSEQVWVLQPTWENQHQPHNPQVRPCRVSRLQTPPLSTSACDSQSDRRASPNRKLDVKRSAAFPLASNNLPHALWINVLFVCSLSQIAGGSSRVCLRSQEQTGASGQLPGGHPWCLLLFGGLSQTFRSHPEMMSSCRPNGADYNGAWTDPTSAAETACIFDFSSLDINDVVGQTPLSRLKDQFDVSHAAMVMSVKHKHPIIIVRLLVSDYLYGPTHSRLSRACWTSVRRRVRYQTNPKVIWHPTVLCSEEQIAKVKKKEDL